MLVSISISSIIISIIFSFNSTSCTFDLKVNNNYFTCWTLWSSAGLAIYKLLLNGLWKSFNEFSTPRRPLSIIPCPTISHSSSACLCIFIFIIIFCSLSYLLLQVFFCILLSPLNKLLLACYKSRVGVGRVHWAWQLENITQENNNNCL